MATKTTAATRVTCLLTVATVIGSLGISGCTPKPNGPEPAAEQFFAALAAGELDGSLEASTAVRLATLLRYATGLLPLEAYEVESARVGTPAVLVDDLTDALTRAVEELTRPIDAIKHQAKTVTVGISRSEEVLFAMPLVAEVLAAGAPRSRLGYKALRTLAALDPAVAEVLGYTRYRIDGDVEAGTATISVLDRGGVARQIPSRTEREPQLRGTKHTAASEREVMVARGRSDGRTVVLVPEAKGAELYGLTLLHVRLADRLPADVARAVMVGYRNRYAALVDLVLETEAGFDDGRLADVAAVDLLLEPVTLLADRWRSG
jgi:glucosamine--fructose-6-phosphate aminotransferase (isomerizing)